MKGDELSQHKPARGATWLPKRTKIHVNVTITGINIDLDEKL